MLTHRTIRLALAAAYFVGFVANVAVCSTLSPVAPLNAVAAVGCFVVGLLCVGE